MNINCDSNILSIDNSIAPLNQQIQVYDSYDKTNSQLNVTASQQMTHDQSYKNFKQQADKETKGLEQLSS